LKNQSLNVYCEYLISLVYGVYIMKVGFNSSENDAVSSRPIAQESSDASSLDSGRVQQASSPGQTMKQNSSATSVNLARDLVVSTENQSDLVENIYDDLAFETYQLMQAISMMSPDTVYHQFPDVPCPKASCIQVPSVGHLHANKIAQLDNRNYVAAQFPFRSTAEIFWKACLEQASIIVDLSRPSDAGCYPYYPLNELDVLELADFEITLSEHNKIGNDTHLYQYIVKDKDSGNQRNLTRLHYTGWPDHGKISPSDFQVLLNTIEAYMQKEDENKMGVDLGGRRIIKKKK